MTHLPTDFPSESPTDRILQALTTGEKARGDLLDASGVASYSELEALLNQLIEQQKISAHWAEMGYRTYRIASATPVRPGWFSQ